MDERPLPAPTRHGRSANALASALGLALVQIATQHVQRYRSGCGGSIGNIHSIAQTICTTACCETSEMPR